jgi:hypothetical protein
MPPRLTAASLRPAEKKTAYFLWIASQARNDGKGRKEIICKFCKFCNKQFFLNINIMYQSIFNNIKTNAAGESNTAIRQQASPKSHTSRRNMLIRACAAVVIAVLTASGGYAQKLTGNLAPLKGQAEVHVAVDFSDMTVNRKPEADYIASNTADKSEEDAAKWLAEWNTDLRRLAVEKIAQGINDVTGKKNLFTAGDFPDAECTVHVRVINIETGFFGGVVSRPAVINAEVTFLKKGDGEPFASVAIPKATHRIGGTIPYFVTRISMSFGALGQAAGQVVAKNLK